uniref:Pentatricopeptide repeat-containing protein n=1 Tax=Chenopodium quinoa TaxID=63459 RepID=A0A803KNR1_CHEQI
MESYGHFMPNVVIYNTLIDSLCKDNLLPQALRLFKELKVKGISPNVVTYNTLIRGMLTLGQPKEAQEMLTEMLRNNITPTTETYNMLIDMYCKDGKVGEARDIFVTFTTLINGFIHSNQFHKAVHLLDKILKLGLQPTLVTYGSIFKGLCRSVDNADALKLLRNMESYGHCMPGVVIYSTIIDSF